MLPDDIPYRTRKPKLLRKIDPVPHVGFRRQLGEVWGKFVMRVLHVNLILNEVVRTLCLADIMVIGTHSGQEWIRTNRLGCSFSQIAHQYACLLYTSDAADDLTRVDLGGRRIIKKKKKKKNKLRKKKE